MNIAGYFPTKTRAQILEELWDVIENVNAVLREHMLTTAIDHVGTQ